MPPMGLRGCISRELLVPYDGSTYKCCIRRIARGLQSAAPSEATQSYEPSARSLPEPRTTNTKAMSEIQALKLARDFRNCDDNYRKSEKLVQNYISEGYTPDEALMLAGISGYNN